MAGGLHRLVKAAVCRLVTQLGLLTRGQASVWKWRADGGESLAELGSGPARIEVVTLTPSGAA